MNTKNQTTFAKRLLFVLLISSLFISCEPEEESGYGNYIIMVSNYTAENQNYNVYLDDQMQGQLYAHANHSVSGSYCDDLVGAANADNVLVLTLVSSGDHTLTLVNSVDETTASTTNFHMSADGCTEKPFIID